MNQPLVKGLIAVLLLVGIVMVIVGAVASQTVIAVVGDVLVVAGILVFLFSRRAGTPTSGSAG